MRRDRTLHHKRLAATAAGNPGIGVDDHRDMASKQTALPRDGTTHWSGNGSPCADPLCAGSAHLEALDPRIAVEHLSRRANALEKLLDTPDNEPFATALDAIVIALQPRAAGIALLHSDRSDLTIEAAWAGGPLKDAVVWRLTFARLRDIVGAGDAGWTGRLTGGDLPLREHLGGLEGAEVMCHVLNCRGAVAGILFHVLDAQEHETQLDFRAFARLVAGRISAGLDLAADRRDQSLSRKEFRDAAEMSFDWFWETDAQFRIVHLSRQWCDVVRKDLAELAGRSFDEIGIATSGTRWGELIEELSSRGEVHGFDARVVGPDGTYDYWKINGRAFRDERGVLLGYRGSCTDVTAEVVERKRAEKAERLLREAIEALPQGFILFDEEDHLVVCNERYKALYPEISDILVPGVEFLDLTRAWATRTPDRREGRNVDDLIAWRVRAHRERRREFEMKRADGRAYLVHEQKTKSACSVWLQTDITAIKDREVELSALGDVLRTRNHHFDVTINSISDGLMMISADGKLVLCNRRWCEYFNVPPGLCREGTDAGAVVDYFEQAGYAPRLRQRYLRKLQQVRKAGVLVFSWELPDGRIFEITAVATKDDSVLVAYRDITIAERQSAVLREQATQFEALSQALAQQNSYFDSALNAMVQALAMFDRNDRLIVCNKRFQEVLGLPEDLVKKGAPVSKIGLRMEKAGLMDDAASLVGRTHGTVREQGSVSVKMRFRDDRVFEVQGLRLDNDDVLFTFYDITAMEQHARRLNEYAERLEYSNRELEEFAYVASHDLQEPLRKIEAFGDRLRQKYADRLDDNGCAYLERMQHASRRMRSLISDLLDYSRISTKTKPFAKVDMREVVEGVIADLEIALEASGAEVSVCDLPCLDADRPQMQRLFQNLIANAIKFAKPDVEARIEITVESEGADGAAPMCRLQVRDNGIGFDNRHAEQVFKIFHRLHGRSEYEGTGIGLATCRKIVERHSGTIAASSEPGVGTTITVRLPMHRPLQGGQP